MSWHPAVVFFAVIDVALILGIATVTVVQRLARAARWRARREARALVDSSLRTGGDAAVDRVVANVDGRLGLRATAQARIEVRLLRKLPVTVLLPRLLALADCGKERLVLASLGAIGENPSAYGGALVMLTQLVRHGRPRERFVASWAGLRILAKYPEMLEAIQRDLLPDVRLMVVRAAGCVLDRGDVRAVEAEDVVRQAMNDPEAPIRRAGILVLSRLAGQGALLELFAEAMNDSMLDVRVAAARAIAAVGKTLDARWLCQALAQADPQTGEAFLIALTHSERSIPEEIVRIALDDRAQHRTAAIWLLGASRYRSAQHALAQLLQSPGSAPASRNFNRSSLGGSQGVPGTS